MSTRPSNLVEPGKAENGLPVLSVGEVSALLKRAVEETFPRVRVRGEVSGLTRAQSGHLYLTLKDDDAVLDGVCWRSTAARLHLAPEDGMEVVATGRLTTYAQRSRYQIMIEQLELAGEGALLKLLEERRRKLAAEGLFDPAAKKPLPFLPAVIGVVTSPTGAVIRDILHRLADRFPRRVLLWPVRVQGDGAAAEIAAAIRGFNKLKRKGPVPIPDLLIVARGGGSLEDLWAFNEEAVVRAAAASRIPLISAVGHETDTTLIDFAADARAPTPTAAAEMAVPVRADLLAMVADDGARLLAAATRRIEENRVRLGGLARGLPDVGRLVQAFDQRLDDWADRLRNAIGAAMDGRRSDLAHLMANIPKPLDRLAHANSRLLGETRALKSAAATLVREQRRALVQAARLLDSTSYERVLERGFVLVTGAAGETVPSVAGLAPGDDVTLGFYDGKADATVTGIGGRSGGGPTPARKKRKRRRKLGTGDDRQGTLL